MKRDLWIMAVSYTLWGIGEGIFIYFHPVYLQQLGAGPVAIGMILGASGVAMAAAQIPTGFLADRFGRRPFIWGAWILASLAIWVMALADNLPLFIFGFLAYSFSAFGAAAQNSYIARAGPEYDLGRILTLLMGLYFLGAVIGSLAGGAIGDAHGLRAAYRIAAVVLIVPTLLVLFIHPQAVERQPKGAGRFDLLRNRAFWALLAVIFVAMTASCLPYPLAPNHLQNQHHLSLGEIGRLNAIGSLGTAAILLLLGRLKARLAFVAGMACMVLFSILLLFGDSFVWFGLAYFWVGGFRLVRSISTALGRAVVQPSEMGLAFGVIETVCASAFILAPVIAGLLYARDPNLIFSIPLAGIFLSMIIYGVYISFIHPRAEALARAAEGPVPGVN